MIMMMVLAASPLLAVGAPRSFSQLTQLLLRPLSNTRFLSHQPMFYAIVSDTLPCEISNRHSRCIQVLLQSSSRTRSSDAYADVQTNLGPDVSQSLTFKISATSFQGNSRAFSQLTEQELLLGCHPMQRFCFLDPIFCQNDTLVSHWSLANPRFHGSISDSDCLLARQCARTSLFLRIASGSCEPFQKHAKVHFSCGSSPETSSKLHAVWRIGQANGMLSFDSFSQKMSKCQPY